MSAEFMQKPRRAGRTKAVQGDSGFAAFGKPVSTERRSEALQHIRAMGIVNTEAAWVFLVRCVHCHREQYGPAVWDISHGTAVCPWCGEPGKIMTNEEYRAAMEDYWK